MSRRRRALFESLVPDITYDMLCDLLDEQDTRNAADLDSYMDHYLGRVQANRPASMSTTAWEEREAAWTPVPMGRLFVEAIVSALYGRNVARTTGREEWDNYLAEFWSDLPQFMLRHNRLICTVGDGVIRVRPDWLRGVALSSWDGRHVVPLVEPETQEIIGIVYDYLADPIAAQLSRAMKGVRTGVEAVQDRKDIITRHIRDHETGEILQPGIRARFIDGVRVEWAAGDNGLNPLGDYLDGVFTVDLQSPVSVRGDSVLSHILPLLAGLNELSTDGRQLIMWNLFPILWTTADMDEAPVYSPHAIWQLGDKPSGQPAEAGRIEWSGDMSGYLSYYDHIMSELHEIARVPAIATGDLTHIGELSSGRAYEVALKPFLESIAERERCRVQDEEALLELVVAVLAYNGAPGFSGLTSTFAGVGFAQPDMQKIRAALADMSVEFDALQVAEDIVEHASVHSTRIGAGYESIETAIRETHPDWTDDQVREELERVGANKQETLDASAALRVEQQREEMKAAARQEEQPDARGTAAPAAD